MDNQFLCPRCWGHKSDPSDTRDCTYCNPCSYCIGQGTITDIQLSENFKLSELLSSQTAVRLSIPNDPAPEVLQSLTNVAVTLLEPIRKALGPLHIDSGYMSVDLNKAIGGVSTSAHCLGKAADIVPKAPGITRKHVADWAISNIKEFDQIIFEGTWIHIAHNAKKEYELSGHVSFKPDRRQVLMMFKGRYFEYDPNDPRVST